MALGLFATLIIGTIIQQLGDLIPGAAGDWLSLFGIQLWLRTQSNFVCCLAFGFKQDNLILSCMNQRSWHI